MAVLVLLGFAHARRVDETEELMPRHTQPAVVITA
jgi:hypothetical protein